jgi:hypothetical protein
MSSEFHFYFELKKDKYYSPLIPRQEAGLVVIYLYDQWKAGKYNENNFTEAAVSDAIEQVASDLGSSYERTPRERFKSINAQLQEYFLRRNEETNLYRITQYGIDFCERLWKKLENDFSPSDVERVLTELIHSLRRSIAENSFRFWFERQFNPQRNYVKSQVDSLYQQVEVAVVEFRESTNADDRTFLETVRDVDAKLERVGSFSKELTEAFLGADEMKSLLLEFAISGVEDEDNERIQEVRQFVSDIKADLEIVSQRIERVRFKLRQFINRINQRNFDRNTELFLRLLLTNSQLKRDGSSKSIGLPDRVELKAIHQDEEKFIIVQEGRIIPKLPVKVLRPKQDPEKRKARLEKANEAMVIRQKVRKWLSKLDQELRKTGKLELTSCYYQILTEEPEHGNEIALKVANGLMRRYSKLQTHQISIDKTMIVQQSFPDTAIWQMQITQN